MSILLVLSKIFVLFIICNAMTMKQIKSTGKMMRKSCQPKNNVEDVMCYIACIMKMANTIKNGKLNYEAAMKQADLLLPDEIKEPTKAAITACRKVPDSYKDLCEASFHVTKCIYKENPSVFFFP
ncbi:unnamed protein product [Leptidea sinapis]|uniref:Uncharacterized protein n=1 Tax=Leptidea sinapis TaxID=189913 RepID=A0A5E4QBV9_9NEOP|nr:unnamed protein product [Leptidea sinapis]